MKKELVFFLKRINVAMNQIDDSGNIGIDLSSSPRANFDSNVRSKIRIL